MRHCLRFWANTLCLLIFIVSSAGARVLFADDVQGPTSGPNASGGGTSPSAQPNTATSPGSTSKETPKESSPSGKSDNTGTNTNGASAERKEPQANGQGSQKPDVDIVTHSMGGIVTRSGHGTSSAPIGKSVYLAAPKFGPAKAFIPESSKETQDPFGDQLNRNRTGLGPADPNSRDTQYPAGD